MSSEYSLFFISCFIVFFCFSEFSSFVYASKFTPKQFNLSAVAKHWGPAGATWYGGPNGDGSDGGSCGYGGAVSQAPFTSKITAVSPSLYKSGKECGACYLVKCTKHRSCSGKPTRVVITDSCLGGVCLVGSAHFDLSGTSFGAMAKPGQENNLRNAGLLQIRYARVACDYSGKTIAFHVDQGSNSNYIAVVIEYEEGDGDLAGVGLMEESKSREWRHMAQSWGAVWKLDAGSELKPPLSIRLTSRYSGATIVAKDVIPVGWQPGATYRSLINF